MSTQENVLMRLYHFLFLFLSATFADAQSSWQLKKSEANIKVFTRDNAASTFKEVRVEATFAGTPEKLLSILTDVDHHKAWVYRTEKVYLIKRLSPHELLYYAETNVPLFSNRDIAIRMTYEHDATKGTLLLKTVGEPNAVPVRDGIVRIRKFAADYVVRKVSPHQISIVYNLSIDPGGSMSAGLANMFVTRGPLETFQALEKELAR
jgi:START domain